MVPNYRSHHCFLDITQVYVNSRAFSIPLYVWEVVWRAVLHIRLVLRGPTAREPYTRDGEISLHATIELLHSKPERCATLGIYFEGRAVFTIVADKLASSCFSHLTQLALINIEPVWTTDRAEKLQPTLEFLKIGEPAMRHLHLVGFGLSMRNNCSFRHIAILVLGDLDRTTAPTMDKLY
jgi:hypothetical protein